MGYSKYPFASENSESSEFEDQLEIHQGKHGYRFLLAVATGLESAIPGETDVFGQFKEAIKNFEARNSSLLRELRPWFQKLTEDVKEIRSRYLQGAGGSSYGSVTRMLLSQVHSGSIFLVGAGQMARSVVPYLLESELLVWNRGEERLNSLLEKVQKLAPTAAPKTLQAEFEGWKTAQDVVVCVPPSDETDQARVDTWNARANHTGTVLHLGLLDAKGTVWEGVKNLKTLADLFAIQKNQGEARRAQIQQARYACSEKANLRALGGPASLAHGWEDLAVFNTLVVE